MMPQTQLIFDKSDSVHLRIEKCKNHSHTSLKKKCFEFLLIKKSIFRLYKGLNTCENITLMDIP